MAAELEYILEQGACIPEDMLMDYAAHKLTAAQTHAVEKHLLECEMCSDALEGLMMIKASDSKSIISEINNKIDSRVFSENSEVKVIPFRFNFKTAAVIALFLLAGGSYWYMKNRVDEKMLAQNAAVSGSVSTDSISAQIVPLVNSDQKSEDPAPFQPKFSPEKENKPIYSQELKKEGKSVQIANDETKTEDDVTKPLNDNSYFKDKEATAEVKETFDELTKRQSGSASEVNRQADAAPSVIETTVSAKIPGSKKTESYVKEDLSESREMANAEFEKSIPLYRNAKKKYEQKKYKEASIDFEKLINDTSSNQYDDVKWLLANCYLKMAEEAKSQKLLFEISNSNSIHKKDAALLLEKK